MKRNNEDYFYISGKHYDTIARSRKKHNRVPFFVKQAKQHGDPVLELACGTGRISIPIAEQGMLVTGLDFSDIMLDHAIRKSKENNVSIEWVKGDMTNFNLKKKFSTIIMTGAAMNWILDNKSIENCLICVRKHLRKNGRFIFDVFNPNLDILQRDGSEIYPMYEYPNPDGEGTVIVSGSNTYDKVSQINFFKSYYKIENKEIVKNLKLRMFYPQELDALLYYNGFSIEKKYGSFEEKPFYSDSNLQIVVCHKT
ncbi:MAG: class I SAM-dependent methyltransferase [Candidatus Lokiarchaeia archaeon]